jgi:hypothetical protein
MPNVRTPRDTHQADRRISACDRSGFSSAISIGKTQAQMDAQKYFPKIHQWHLRQTAFLDTSLSFVGEELRSDVRGSSLDLRKEVNNGHARRARPRRRCCSLYVPGSNRGRIPDGRRVVQRALWLADRSRNRSRVFPVPEPNGSRNLLRLGRSSLPLGKACNA